MNKNMQVTLTVTGVTDDGFGVGRVDNIAVFVPLAAVGDVIKAQIVKVKKNYCYGKLIEIITPSSHRIESDCPLFNKCGGCAYRHIDYDFEKQLKSEKARNAFLHIGGIDMLPQPIITGDTCRYRNKAQLPFDNDGNVGFYAFHSHRVIKVDSCLLQPEEFDKIAQYTAGFVKEKRLTTYTAENTKGLVRHLYLRKSALDGTIMAVLVINGNKLPCGDEFVSGVTSLDGINVSTVVLNINTKNTNVILGNENITLFGEGFLTDILCGVKVRLSPLSFYQVNHQMAEKLYKKAAAYANPAEKTVIDLYCGAGTIGLSMARMAKRIIGVEIVEDAVKDAVYNSKINGIDNAEFICGDAARSAEILAKRGIKADVVIVDPPRKGCDSQLLQTIADDFAPERIVYVSCNVATLARDCAQLEKTGYKLIEYTPVDLFPRTSHTETVALLIKE